MKQNCAPMKMTDANTVARVGAAINHTNLGVQTMKTMNSDSVMKTAEEWGGKSFKELLDDSMFDVMSRQLSYERLILNVRNDALKVVADKCDNEGCPECAKSIRSLIPQNNEKGTGSQSQNSQKGNSK